jgi:hypothetical protein
VGSRRRRGKEERANQFYFWRRRAENTTLNITQKEEAEIF